MTAADRLAAVATALAIAGCTTTAAGDKPVLTKRAFERAAATCGVRPLGYSRSRRHLPRVDFTYPDAAQETEDRAVPSVNCMGEQLRRYRYEYFSPRADPARPTAD